VKRDPCARHRRSEYEEHPADQPDHRFEGYIHPPIIGSAVPSGYLRLLDLDHLRSARYSGADAFLRELKRPALSADYVEDMNKVQLKRAG
jgi:hypothetical protein